MTMPRLLLLVVALVLVTGCAHRDPLNPNLGPSAQQPLP